MIRYEIYYVTDVLSNLFSLIVSILKELLGVLLSILYSLSDIMNSLNKSEFLLNCNFPE